MEVSTYVYSAILIWLVIALIFLFFSEVEAVLQVHASGSYGDYSSDSHLLDSSRCLYRQQW